MEALKEEAIQAFLSTGSGYGYGSGSGYGYGSGFGDGDGSGYGYGDGSGYGGGSGYGVVSFCGQKVYQIDGVPTLIDHVHGNAAKGRILRDDLTTEACYIVKHGSLFAHGETLRKAMDALRDKLFEDMPEEERIAEFVKSHDWGKQYPSADYYEWHHRLTGSCDIGRLEFEMYPLAVILNPALLPEGLTRAEYMRICISMIDVPAAVFALPDAGESAGAKVELAYCRYIGKPVVELEEDRA